MQTTANHSSTSRIVYLFEGAYLSLLKSKAGIVPSRTSTTWSRIIGFSIAPDS